MQFSWYKDLFILTHVRRLGSKNTNRAVWKKQFAEQLQKNHTFAGLYFELKNIRKYFVTIVILQKVMVRIIGSWSS